MLGLRLCQKPPVQAGGIIPSNPEVDDSCRMPRRRLKLCKAKRDCSQTRGSPIQASLTDYTGSYPPSASASSRTGSDSKNPNNSAAAPTAL